MNLASPEAGPERKSDPLERVQHGITDIKEFEQVPSMAFIEHVKEEDKILQLRCAGPERKSDPLELIRHGITDINDFAQVLSMAFIEHVKEEDKILQLRCKDFTKKAVALFYVDVIFDFLFSFVAGKLEDLVHLVLFCLTLPVRSIFRVIHRSRCSKAEDVPILRSNRMCEDVYKNKLNCQHCQYSFSHRMSTFGVLLRKLGEEEKRDEGSYDFDATRLLCFDFKFQSYDSVNNYTNLATIMFFLCVYASAVRVLLFSEQNWCVSFINWFDEWFHYELNLADFTLICIWIIISLILRIVERVYFLLGLTKKTASVRKISITGLLFWNSLREPTDRLLRWNEQEDSQTYFHALVTEFQLLFVRFFCDEGTFLKMRRKYRDSQMFLQNQLSFHKDVFAFVIALVASLVVKYFIEGSYSLEFVPRAECTAARGYCIDHELEDECWCGINLLNDVASSFLVALVGAIGSAATVRAVMNQIFQIWRQRKLTYRFACITSEGWGDVNPTVVRSNTNVKEEEYVPIMDYAIIPCNADIYSAFYGIGSDNFIKDVSNQEKIIRSEDIYRGMSKYVDVTEQVKDYLLQSRGNVIFSIKPKKKRCLVISGLIREAQDATRDVTEIFRISDKDNKTVWERELFTWKGKHHEMQDVIEIHEKQGDEIEIGNDYSSVRGNEV